MATGHTSHSHRGTIGFLGAFGMVVLAAPALHAQSTLETNTKGEHRTIGHRILRLETPLGATDEDTQRLDDLIDAASRRIVRRSHYTRNQARQVLSTIDSLTRERGIRIEHAWLLHTALRTGTFDCDTLTLLYLAIGEKLDLPLAPARVRGAIPGHVVVRWHLRRGRTLDWDTTTGAETRGDRARRADSTRLDPLSTEQLLAIQYFNQGVHWGRQGSLSMALASLNRSIRIDGGVPVVHVARGEVLLRQYLAAVDRSPWLLERALSPINQALRLEPRYADAYVIRGVVQHHRGWAASASSDFRKAVRIERENPAAHYYLGLSRLAEGRPARANRSFNQTIRITEPKVDDHSRQLAADARFYRGNPDGGRAMRSRLD